MTSGPAPSESMACRPLKQGGNMRTMAPSDSNQIQKRFQGSNFPDEVEIRRGREDFGNLGACRGLKQVWRFARKMDGGKSVFRTYPQPFCVDINGAESPVIAPSNLRFGVGQTQE